MFNKKRKNNKGFTLVELLVAIAIIGILAVVAVPSLMKNINRAKATDVITYVTAAKTAAISEYAATQTVGTYTDESNGALAGMIEDKPADVEKVSVKISNSNEASGEDTKMEITVTLATNSKKLVSEVQKQANANIVNSTTEVIVK